MYLKSDSLFLMSMSYMLILLYSPSISRLLFSLVFSCISTYACVASAFVTTSAYVTFLLTLFDPTSLITILLHFSTHIVSSGSLSLFHICPELWITSGLDASMMKSDETCLSTIQKTNKWYILKKSCHYFKACAGA